MKCFWPHTADWSPGRLFLRRGEHRRLQQLPDLPAAPEAVGEGLLPILPSESCTLRLAFFLTACGASNRTQSVLADS